MDSAKKLASAAARVAKTLSIDPGPGIVKKVQFQPVESPEIRLNELHEEIDRLIKQNPDLETFQHRRVTRALYSQFSSLQSEDTADSASVNTYEVPKATHTYTNDTVDTNTQTHLESMDQQQVKVVVQTPVAIPTFQGDADEEIGEFLTKYTKLSSINGWSDQEKLERLELYLQGTAQRALFNIVKKGETNWNTVVASLKRVFKGTDEEERAKQKLYSRRQAVGESSLVHAEDIIYLAYQYNSEMSEKQIIDIIWKSSLPSIADKLIAKNVKTLDELKATLESIEEGIAKYNCTLRNQKSEREIQLEEKLKEAEKLLSMATLNEQVTRVQGKESRGERENSYCNCRCENDDEIRQKAASKDRQPRHDSHQKYGNRYQVQRYVPQYYRQDKGRSYDGNRRKYEDERSGNVYANRRDFEYSERDSNRDRRGRETRRDNIRGYYDEKEKRDSSYEYRRRKMSRDTSRDRPRRESREYRYDEDRSESYRNREIQNRDIGKSVTLQTPKN